MAVKRKNAENHNNAAPDMGNKMAATENASWQPESGNYTDDDVKKYKKNMGYAKHPLEDNSNTPEVLDEEMKAFVKEGLERSFLALTGMTYATAVSIFQA